MSDNRLPITDRCHEGICGRSGLWLWLKATAKIGRQGSRDANPMVAFLRKEVIQPQVPLRLPCYDFTPVAELTVAGCPLLRGRRTVFG